MSKNRHKTRRVRSAREIGSMELQTVTGVMKGRNMTGTIVTCIDTSKKSR